MTDLACGASVTLTPYPYGTYMWDVLGGENVNLHFQSGTNSNSVNFTFTGDDHGWLRMDAYYNGSPHPTIEYRISADCGRSSPENLIIAYPNPVSGILTIELDAAFVEMTRIFQPTARRNQEPTFDVRLYDRLGNMLRHATTKGEAVHFNVYGLPVGMYYVHIYDGTNEKPKIKQIVVER